MLLLPRPLPAREFGEIHFSAPHQGAAATPARVILSLRVCLIARNLDFNTRFGALPSRQFHIASALEQKGKAQQELLRALLAGGFLIKYLNYYSRAVLPLESTSSWDLILEKEKEEKGRGRGKIS